MGMNFDHRARFRFFSLLGFHGGRGQSFGRGWFAVHHFAH
jgi:hypothetical protein